MNNILIEIDASRRSGHHAFTQWLISNLHENQYEENLCKFKYNHVIGNQKILWVNEGYVNVEGNKEHISKCVNDHSIIIITYEVLHQGRLDQPNYTILTEELRRKWGIKKHIQISFVRDILNNLSSLKKIQDFSDGDLAVKNFLQIYKNQLKKTLIPFGGVIYDKWISDEEYANQVCLSILGKNNMFHPLKVGGTGSSFGDKLNMQSLLNRYKQFPPPQWTVELIKQDKELMGMLEILEMNKTIG